MTTVASAWRHRVAEDGAAASAGRLDPFRQFQPAVLRGLQFGLQIAQLRCEKADSDVVGLIVLSQFDVFGIDPVGELADRPVQG